MISQRHTAGPSFLACCGGWEGFAGVHPSPAPPAKAVQGCRNAGDRRRHHLVATSEAPRAKQSGHGAGADVDVRRSVSCEKTRDLLSGINRACAAAAAAHSTWSACSNRFHSLPPHHHSSISGGTEAQSVDLHKPPAC